MKRHDIAYTQNNRRHNRVFTRVCTLLLSCEHLAVGSCCVHREVYTRGRCQHFYFCYDPSFVVCVIQYSRCHCEVAIFSWIILMDVLRFRSYSFLLVFLTLQHSSWLTAPTFSNKTVSDVRPISLANTSTAAYVRDTVNISDVSRKNDTGRAAVESRAVFRAERVCLFFKLL